MLIEFRIANYRSIGEEQILSLLPAPKQKEFSGNILTNGKYKALNTIAIYGANASGKSNLILAMNMLDQLVHLSARSSSTTKLPYDPFLLRDGWDKKPTKMEIVFIIDRNKYRYGIEYFQDRIEKEWLYRKSEGREVSLFLREKDGIDVSSGFKGNSKIIDAAIEATRDNSLFLSTCDMLNIEEAKLIFQWFKNFDIFDGLNTKRGEFQTVNMWGNDSYKPQITDYLTKLNLGIKNIDVTIIDFDSTQLSDTQNTNIKTLEKSVSKKVYSVTANHKFYSELGAETEQFISWKMEERESAGSKKAFQLSGPVIWHLIHGGVLIIDEIEAKMHPIMTLNTISLFLNKETNPNNAQLIFATHDTNLLTYCKLRRDQIYFSEKNTWESTEIYSLSDFVYLETVKPLKSKKERPDTDKEKRYLEGRYGAIPVLGNFKFARINSNGKKEEP